MWSLLLLIAHMLGKLGSCDWQPAALSKPHNIAKSFANSGNAVLRPGCSAKLRFVLIGSQEIAHEAAEGGPHTAPFFPMLCPSVGGNPIRKVERWILVTLFQLLLRGALRGKSGCSPATRGLSPLERILSIKYRAQGIKCDCNIKCKS